VVKEDPESTKYLWGGKAIRAHLAKLGLRMSKTTMYRRIADAGLPAHRTTLGLVTTVEKLEAWVEEQVSRGTE
jgi:hypothetical protein